MAGTTDQHMVVTLIGSRAYQQGPMLRKEEKTTKGEVGHEQACCWLGFNRQRTYAHGSDLSLKISIDDGGSYQMAAAP